jgi:hypothetical protein
MTSEARNRAWARWTKRPEPSGKVEPLTPIELVAMAERVLDSETASAMRTVDAMALLGEVDRLKRLAREVGRAESKAMMERDQARELLLRVSREKFTPALVDDIMTALAQWGYL